MTFDPAPRHVPTLPALSALLAGEALLLGLASMAHRGWLLHGHAHGPAAVAETVLAVVLAAGAIAAALWPRAARPVAVACQIVALLGVCVGLWMIAIGVGPQSSLDLVYHALLVAGLIAGIWTAARLRHDA